jgi:hypothetical protein
MAFGNGLCPIGIKVHEEHKRGILVSASDGPEMDIPIPSHCLGCEGYRKEEEDT